MKAFESHGSDVRAGFYFVSPLASLLLGAFTATGQPTAVIGWGANRFGQTTPQAGLSNATTVAGGFTYSLALRADGTAVGWGQRLFLPPGLNDIAALVSAGPSGGSHDLAVRNNGTVIAWGSPCCNFGQSRVPSGLSNVIAVSAGGLHSLALKNDGTLLGWGDNFFGQTNVPPGLSNVIAIAAGGSHNLAVRSDGTVVAWGSNLHGETDVPPRLSNVVAVAASAFSMALKSDGTVVTWGGTAMNVTPEGLASVVAIAAGNSHSVALKSDGTLIAWGANSSGETNVPSKATNVTAIAAGFEHSLALTRSTPPPWPRVTEQPRHQRTLVGQPVKLNIAATSTAPLSYRWQFRGRDIPEANNAVLLLDNPQLSDSGDYAVIVTADSLSVRSAPAFLAVSNPPVAQAQTSLGLEDSDLIIKLDGFDSSGLPLTTQIVELPAAGRLFQFGANGRGDPIGTAPSLVVDPNWRVIYVPDANDNGTEFDTFLFTVGNEIGDSLPGKVRIDIAPVNDAPSFVKGLDLVVPEDAGPQVISGWAQGVRAGPSDETNQRLSFIATTDNPALFSVQPGVSSEGTLTFLSAPNAHGIASVTIRLMDDGGMADGGADVSEPQTFVIRVSSVNDAPTTRIVANRPVVFPSDFEHPALLSCNWWNSCLKLDGSMSSDVENDALSYLWFVDPEPAPFSDSVVTTNCLEVGTHTVILMVTDSAGLSDTDSLVIEVVTAPLAIELLIEEINEAHKAGILLSRKIKRELTATLLVAFNHAAHEQLRETQKALDAFEKKVRAQLAKTQPTAATTWIRWSQAVSEGIQNCIRPSRKPKNTSNGDAQGLNESN